MPRNGFNDQNTPKIKIRLEKFHRAIVFQILEMDERFRSRDENHYHTFEYTDDDGETAEFGVISECTPGLDCDGIYLRGDAHEDDFDVSVEKYTSNKERDAKFDLINRALADWAKNWEGWAGPIPKEQHDDLEVAATTKEF